MANYNDDSTPAICDSCLGLNPYVEMKRQINGAECKICSKPFTVFKWYAEFENGEKTLKKTVICLTCARSKNRCQSCLLDLTFGISIELRDKLLKIAKLDNNKLSITNDIVSNAKNTTSRLYNSNLLEDKFKNEEINDHLIDNNELKSELKTNLQSFVDNNNNDNNNDNDNKKNDDQSNSSKNEISKSELLKLLKLLPLNGNLLYTPKDKKIKSFFFFGNTPSLSIYQIKEYFINLFNNKDIVTSIYTKANFGFIEFKDRQIAENLASLIYKNQLKSLNCKDYKKPCLIIISNIPIRLSWSINSNNSSTNYSNTELKKIINIIEKHLIKLAKNDSELLKDSKTIIKNAKISKP